LARACSIFSKKSAHKLTLSLFSLLAIKYSGPSISLALPAK
jgi:hypothetical protein